MRVLYVIDSLQPGGAETSLAALAAPLIRGGLDLEVLPLTDRPGVADELRSAGATVHPALGARRLRGLRPLRTRIRSSDPDLVHTTLFEADVLGRTAARLERVRSVTSLVTTGYLLSQPTLPHHVKQAGALRADRVTARWATRLHAVSHAVADEWAPVLHVDPTRIDVIHRGRDPERLGRRSAARSAAVRARFGLGDRPIVVAVARQDPAKGLDTLLRGWPEVVRHHPGAVLLLVGGAGSATGHLHQLMSATPAGTVMDLGHRDDTADLIASADALVAPSRREGLPGVLIEAMFLEVPIVATDIAPVREVLGPAPAATLVPVDDVHALAHALDATLSGELRPDVVAGRQRALGHFTLEMAASRLLDFYDRACSEVPW